MFSVVVAITSRNKMQTKRKEFNSVWKCSIHVYVVPFGPLDDVLDASVPSPKGRSMDGRVNGMNE